VRNEIDRYFDLAISEAFGTELELDEKNGMFLYGFRTFNSLTPSCTYFG
jgi:hypothetical protein